MGILYGVPYGGEISTGNAIHQALIVSYVAADRYDAPRALTLLARSVERPQSLAWRFLIGDR